MQHAPQDQSQQVRKQVKQGFRPHVVRSDNPQLGIRRKGQSQRAYTRGFHGASKFLDNARRWLRRRRTFGITEHGCTVTRLSALDPHDAFDIAARTERRVRLVRAWRREYESAEQGKPPRVSFLIRPGEHASTDPDDPRPPHWGRGLYAVRRLERRGETRTSTRTLATDTSPHADAGEPSNSPGKTLGSAGTTAEGVILGSAGTTAAGVILRTSSGLRVRLVGAQG